MGELGRHVLQMYSFSDLLLWIVINQRHNIEQIKLMWRNAYTSCYQLVCWMVSFFSILVHNMGSMLTFPLNSVRRARSRHGECSV